MSSYFTLTLDTAPPASPQISLNGGSPSTGQAEVLAVVTTADYDGGARDVDQMLLWGDVEPSADPSVQADESTSVWQPYRELSAIRLSSGAGRKTVNARLRDDVGNTTLVFCAAIDYDPSLPYVSITTPVTASRISKAAGFDTAQFAWECQVDFDHFEVRVVPSIASPHTSGVPLGTSYGSTNVGLDAIGSPFPANTPITTVVTGTDLQLAAPGDSDKVVKVFVTAGGVWSV